MIIHRIGLSLTNDYLVPIGRNFLLIDTGWEFEWRLFCKRLEQMGIGLNQISHVMLSHHHGDHCGLLNRLMEQVKGIKIIMSISCKALLAGGRDNRTNTSGYINRRVKVLAAINRTFDRRMGFAFPQVLLRPFDVLVEHDIQLRDIGIDIDGRILCTPGHTPDSISLLFSDGDCIVGDAAAKFLQLVGTKYCGIYVDDIEEFYLSWQKLVNEGAKRIYPAHGKSFSIEKLSLNMGKNYRNTMVQPFIN
jgi:glyoxylase-like metal-dependent hydrolase (beta-lactamase superfamily II)